MSTNLPIEKLDSLKTASENMKIYTIRKNTKFEKFDLRF